MPIYEYYCPDNHTIYQFYAKTLAQGQTVPHCPDNPRLRMRKLLSSFAVTKGGAREVEPPHMPGKGESAEDARMDAAMGAMEKEFSGMDENNPRTMARMFRRMAELSGEKIGGEMEEMVRKLEEGADPETLEEQMGGDTPGEDDPAGEEGKEPREARHRFRVRRTLPRRDPKLYDY